MCVFGPFWRWITGVCVCEDRLVSFVLLKITAADRCGTLSVHIYESRGSQRCCSDLRLLYLRAQTLVWLFPPNVAPIFYLSFLPKFHKTTASHLQPTVGAIVFGCQRFFFFLLIVFYFLFHEAGKKMVNHVFVRAC